MSCFLEGLKQGGKDYLLRRPLQLRAHREATVAKCGSRDLGGGHIGGPEQGWWGRREGKKELAWGPVFGGRADS